MISVVPEDRLLSTRQLAELTGLSAVTLSRWRSQRKGPPWIRLSASSVAYPLGGYREWVREHTIETGPPKAG